MNPGGHLGRGDIPLVEADRTPVEWRRNTVVLCHCGASNLAPCCDGSHKLLRRPTA